METRRRRARRFGPGRRWAWSPSSRCSPCSTPTVGLGAGRLVAGLGCGRRRHLVVLARWPARGARRPRAGQPGHAGPGRAGRRGRRAGRGRRSRHAPSSPLWRSRGRAGPRRRRRPGGPAHAARSRARRPLRHGGRRVPDPGAERATSPAPSAAGCWRSVLARYAFVARRLAGAVAARAGAAALLAQGGRRDPGHRADRRGRRRPAARGDRARARGRAGAAGRVVRPRGLVAAAARHRSPGSRSTGARWPRRR